MIQSALTHSLVFIFSCAQGIRHNVHMHHVCNTWVMRPSLKMSVRMYTIIMSVKTLLNWQMVLTRSATSSLYGAKDELHFVKRTRTHKCVAAGVCGNVSRSLCCKEMGAHASTSGTQARTRSPRSRGQ